MSATDEIKRELGVLSEKEDSLRGQIKGDLASSEFIEGYQEWYTRAVKIVSLLGKDRLDEFCSNYLPDSNRDIVIQRNYVIQDFIFGVWPIHHQFV